jgi:phosphatidylglycerol:prolipoprotein diacylglycerol transferase
LLVIAALGAVLALFGWRNKTVDLLVVGLIAALGCTWFALTLRGETYQLANVPIYSYGAMLCLSFVAGWYLTLHLGTRDGLPRDVMANCFLVSAVSALVGARLLYVLTNLSEFSSVADVFAMRRGGFVAYGGFLGGFAGSYGYLRRRNVGLLAWADVAVPSLGSGLFLTRIGCYLFGCDFGKPLPDGAPGWLKHLGTFPRWTEGVLADVAGSPAWVQHVREGGLAPDSTASLPVHPTQLYESLAGLALLASVLWLRPHRRFRGEIFLAFTFGYGLLRFLLEIVRDDAERGTFGPTLSRHIYIPLVLLVFVAAFAYGPARSIDTTRTRYASLGASVLPAFISFIAFKPKEFGTPIDVQLSTSQWIGLLTAIGAAVAWERLSSRAADAPSISAEPIDETPPPSSVPPSSTPSTPSTPRRRFSTTQAETPRAKRDGDSEPPPPNDAPDL